MNRATIDLPRADDDRRVREAHAALKAAKRRQERMYEEYVAAAKRLKVLHDKLENKLDAEDVTSQEVREAKAAKAKAVERSKAANAAYDAAVKAEKGARREVRAEIQKLAIARYEELLDELAAIVGPPCAKFVEEAEELEQATRDALGPDPSSAKYGRYVFQLGRPAADRRTGRSGVHLVSEWARSRLGK